MTRTAVRRVALERQKCPKVPRSWPFAEGEEPIVKFRYSREGKRIFHVLNQQRIGSKTRIMQSDDCEESWIKSNLF